MFGSRKLLFFVWMATKWCLEDEKNLSILLGFYCRCCGGWFVQRKVAIFVHKLRVATLSTAAALRFPITSGAKTRIKRGFCFSIKRWPWCFLTHLGSNTNHIHLVIPRFLAHSSSDFQVYFFRENWWNLYQLFDDDNRWLATKSTIGVKFNVASMSEGTMMAPDFLIVLLQPHP